MEIFIKDKVTTYLFLHTWMCIGSLVEDQLVFIDPREVSQWDPWAIEARQAEARRSYLFAVPNHIGFDGQGRGAVIQGEEG